MGDIVYSIVDLSVLDILDWRLFATLAIGPLMIVFPSLASIIPVYIFNSRKRGRIAGYWVTAIGAVICGSYAALSVPVWLDARRALAKGDHQTIVGTFQGIVGNQPEGSPVPSTKVYLIVSGGRIARTSSLWDFKIF